VVKRAFQAESGLQEAKKLATIDHENIIRILGAGGNDKQTVIVMEYAPGGSLADRLVRTYDWEESLKLGIKIARALSVASKEGVVHGNLRPSNVLFDDSDVPKLTDFGMPQHYNSKRNWYAPPEKGASSRGDIYALGVILHQMIYGKTPNYTRQRELYLTVAASRVPSPVLEMLKKLLALQCADRYQSAEEFLYDWENFRRKKNEPVKETPLTNVVVKQKKSRFSGAGVFVIGLGLGMILGIAIAYYVNLYG